MGGCGIEQMGGEKRTSGFSYVVVSQLIRKVA